MTLLTTFEAKVVSGSQTRWSWNVKLAIQLVLAVVSGSQTRWSWNHDNN